MSNETDYTTNVGDTVVTWVTGYLGLFTAKVVQKNPLQLQIDGWPMRLKDGDFVIDAIETAEVQAVVKE